MDERGDFIGFFFEIVNMGDNGLWMVGFWFNFIGCLVFVLDCIVRVMCGVNYVLGYFFNLGVSYKFVFEFIIV